MPENKRNAKVFHFDLYGKREEKYKFLNENNINSIPWEELNCAEPYNFFVPKDFNEIKNYEKGFKMDELFSEYNSGIQTKNDSLTIQFDKSKIVNIINDFKLLDIVELNNKYLIKEGVWKTIEAKKDILSDKFEYAKIDYKPFDTRNTILTQKSSGFIGRPREKTMKHMTRDNFGLCLMRTLVDADTFSSVCLTKNLLDINFYRFQTFLFPLYLYPETNGQQSTEQTALPNLPKREAKTPFIEQTDSEVPSIGGDLGEVRTPNLNIEIVKQISECLRLNFITEKPFNEQGVATPCSFSPIDILDYIYAILHSPTYREKYKEFLKIDFPRVPYPKYKETFWALVKLGGELREIHLLESPKVEKYITQYPIDGNNVVTKPRFVIASEVKRNEAISLDETDCFVVPPRNDGNVYINESQYFANVPEVAWNFYIGGYQPAQKWLKDRKCRTLSFEDISHYQKIIVALTETDRLMKEIDKIEIG
jgi:predicted helicase